MVDKFEMSRELNMLCAKRKIVDNIYSQACVEGIGTTFAQTEDIINNKKISDLTPIQVGKIVCLKRGWEYVFDNIDSPIHLVFIENLHCIIADYDVPKDQLGVIRTQPVMISGSNYILKIPNVDALFYKLRDLSEIECATERAFRTGLYIMRLQPFIDGNKRVGSFVINTILIQNGRGLFIVPDSLEHEYKDRLVTFYETEDYETFMSWLYDNCLFGVNEHKSDGFGKLEDLVNSAK